MPDRNIRRVLIIAFALASGTCAIAQIQSSEEAIQIPIGHSSQSAPPKISGKLIVVTVDQPNRRQSCRVQSYTPEKLVCQRAIGGPRTYLTPQILALILPGDGGLRLRIVLGLNGGMGAAIWGTVVLAAACPACAVATGVAALLLFCAAGATLIGDGVPDRLVFLAPGQHLSSKLDYVEH